MCYLPAYFGLRILWKEMKNSFIICYRMLDHPSQFSKKFIASLFNSPEANLKTFDFVPVGSGQVGDCFRVNI